jgi:hypothetical protein
MCPTPQAAQQLLVRPMLHSVTSVKCGKYDKVQVYIEFLTVGNLCGDEYIFE